MTIHNFTLHLTPIPRLLTKIYEVLRLSSKGAYATAVRSTYTLILGQRCELGFLNKWNGLRHSALIHRLLPKRKETCKFPVPPRIDAAPSQENARREP